MIRLAKVLLQQYILRLRHRHQGLRIGSFSVCDDVQFGQFNTIHTLVRLRSVSLGDFTYVANGARIVNAKIGRFCSLGPDCRIGLGTHPTGYVSTHPAFYSKLQPPVTSLAVSDVVESRTVEIGNDVWIGNGAIIMDGVRIGDGAIVGAGSIVTREVPSYAIVAGVPARVLRYRFDTATIDALRACLWWERDLGWIRAHADSFSNPEKLLRLLAEEPTA